MSVFLWALALVGGTGERGLDLEDVHWLILQSLRQLVGVLSGHNILLMTQVLSHELYLSPSPDY